MFTPYSGDHVIPSVQLGTSEKKSKDSPPPASDKAAHADTGSLNELKKCKKRGDEYITSLTFLCDSVNSAVVSYGADTVKVWLGQAGELNVQDLSNLTIVYSQDGSLVSPAQAAMVAKPETLVVLIGNDGLESAEQAAFVSGYEALIDSILEKSPDTKIICCSLSSVTSDYSGTLTPELISSANEWIRQVCSQRAVWYADTASVLTKNGLLLSEYAAADGVSLNGAGVSAVFDYLCTHGF